MNTITDELELNYKIDEEIDDEASSDPILFKYSITSWGADYSVKDLVRRLNDKVIIIPDFQRNYIWNLSQASRFVESLLLNLPVPSIFLAEIENKKYIVIDGQQRLTSLQLFYKGMFRGKEFKLVGVKEEFDNRTYLSLEESDRFNLDESLIHAIIIRQDDPQNDFSSAFNIFERLNTGGNILYPQEIRSCIYSQGLFNKLLKELNEYESWRKMYHGSANDRMKDQELILRFFALYFTGDRYKRPMKEFLNKFMGKNTNLNLYNETDLKKKFSTIIDFIYKALGDKAFRIKTTINAAVFDAVMVGVAKRLDKGHISNIESFKIKYYELLENESFLKSISTATSDENNVKNRIDLASKYFDCLN
jgi:uncharacterized protein with ParB-like and HNH nuclease domain